MAAPDAHGRLRVLLVEGGPPEVAGSRRRLQALAGAGGAFWPADAEGVCGEFCVTVPRRKEHWTALAEELRGRHVRLEVTLRRYRFSEAPAGGARAGLALDLAALEPLPGGEPPPQI